MSYLYIDTSDHLIFGILSDDFEWDSYINIPDIKSSAKIHGLINQELEKLQLAPTDLEGIFQTSGPGSYTGMRLAEGMVQIFEWQKISIYSFYHFEVPKLLGVPAGAWIANAFKGEYFLYSWGNDVEEIGKLIGTSEMDALIKGEKKLFSHFKNDLIDYEDIAYTGGLIEENPSDLFKIVKKRKVRYNPYYYRSLEEDFTPQVQKD